jgi:beta-fructofuranosidase
MTWGHAISDDLIHWNDMPLALFPDKAYDNRGVYSGCAVDNDGVATVVYTGTTGEKNEIQTVCIATSHDPDLRTWQKYEGNPIISAPPEGFLPTNNFRDPYVWRDGNTWYMVIGAGRPQGSEAVLLYGSPDLYQWEYLHPIYESDATNDYVYECPNFFSLGDKWVLLVSAMPESHVKYFVGTFENLQFHVENEGLVVDGSFFAALSFRDNSGRQIMMDWIRETRPVAHYRSAGWAGVMSLPVELSLSEDNRLKFTPIGGLLRNDAAGDYWEFTDVTEAKLAEIQAQVGDTALKVRVGGQPDFTLYLDHSVAEAFDAQGYRIRRIYDSMGLEALPEFVAFPIQRLQVWKIDSIW